MKTRAELIFDAFEDLISDFLYYHRKNDPVLPVGAIEAAIEENEIGLIDLQAILREKINTSTRMIKYEEKLNEHNH